MAPRRLTAEQTELLHHVELSEAGWHHRALDQFVLSLCSARVQGLTAEQIRSELEAIEVGISIERIRGSIERLRAGKRLVEAVPGLFTFSEAARIEADELRNRALQVEAAAKETWTAAVAQDGGTAASALTWDWFSGKFLPTLVAGQGARTYALLNSQDREVDTGPKAGALFNGLGPDARLAASRCLATFFNSTRGGARDFVLRQLHAQLLSLAVGLPGESIKALGADRKRQLQLKLLLDTNFLFSLLGLHENPANEAAQDLSKLLKNLGGNIHVQLYVSPLTVDEVKRTLFGYQVKLQQLEMTPRLGAIAAELPTEFSGIALKYFEVAKSGSQRISASDYLGPYQRDLVDILRGRGIELYNESLEDLSKSAPVVDDILEQQRIEEQMPPKKRKTYEALRHDITLWHLVARRRPAYLEAPLDATFWIGTVDHRLIAFDQQKRSRDGLSVPVCVHPATLIQMLQLWIPRSERLDAALFDSLRAALPHSFDSADEEMTLRILRALSRYEDVDDLPESMITSILMNQALRVSVQGASEVSEQVSLVRDEIIRAAGEVKRKLVEEEGKAQELAAALEKAKQDASSSGKKFQEVDKKAAELEEKLREERATRSELETRLATIEGVLRSEQMSRADERSARKLAAIRTRVLIGAVLALVAVVLGALWIRHGVASIRDSSLYSAALLTGSLATWLTTVLLVGARVRAISEWSVFVRFRLLAKVVGGVLWTLVTGAAGNALWEWAKTH